MVVRISRPVYLNGLFPCAVHCQWHTESQTQQPTVCEDLKQSSK
jgi:hypothetical protein